MGNETALMQVVLLPPCADIYRKEVALKISWVIDKRLLIAHLTAFRWRSTIQTSDTQCAGMPSCVHVVLEKETNHPFTSTNVEVWQSWGLVFTFGEGWWRGAAWVSCPCRCSLHPRLAFSKITFFCRSRLTDHQCCLQNFAKTAVCKFKKYSNGK